MNAKGHLGQIWLGPVKSIANGANGFTLAWSIPQCLLLNEHTAIGPVDWLALRLEMVKVCLFRFAALKFLK